MTIFKARKEVEKIKQVIVSKYHPKRIVLFGSYAWGKPNKDSDIDLLVVKEATQPRPLREQAIYKILTRYFSDRELPVDVIVHTTRETEEKLAMGDPFVKEILTKGKILYEEIK